MKKKIAIVLVVIICLAAVLFISGRDSGKDDAPDVSTTSAEAETKKDKDKVTEKETEKVSETTTESGSYSPDEVEKKDPDKLVEFELPTLFLDTKYQNNLDLFVKENGYESAEFSFNKKTVKVKLNALSYDIYLVKTGISTISAICETIESEDYPYVVNLGDYEDDFSYVTLLVNQKKFKKAKNADDLFTHVSNCCAYYLLQDSDSPNKYKIDICDEKTGELLATREYNKKDYLK